MIEVQNAVGRVIGHCLPPREGEKVIHGREPEAISPAYTGEPLAPVRSVRRDVFEVLAFRLPSGAAWAAVILKPGQDPTWLPGWRPAPVEESGGSNLLVALSATRRLSPTYTGPIARVVGRDGIERDIGDDSEVRPGDRLVALYDQVTGAMQQAPDAGAARWVLGGVWRDLWHAPKGAVVRVLLTDETVEEAVLGQDGRWRDAHDPARELAPMKWGRPMGSAGGTTPPAPAQALPPRG